jgi:hypothetical protein
MDNIKNSTFAPCFGTLRSIHHEEVLYSSYWGFKSMNVLIGGIAAILSKNVTEVGGYHIV